MTQEQIDKMNNRSLAFDYLKLQADIQDPNSLYNKLRHQYKDYTLTQFLSMNLNK